MIVNRLMLALAILAVFASAGCAATTNWASDPVVPRDAASHEAGNGNA